MEEHAKPGVGGVLGVDPATRWISVGPPTLPSRATGARSSIRFLVSGR